MSRTRQLVKAFTKLFKQISKQFLSAINKKLIWLLRTTFGINKRRGSANAGFVLPTVAMVSIVVVLLTAAILFRSFERSKNASNVRVDTVVFNAATPAIDRARAKIESLLEDPTLPRGIPSDSSLYDALKKSKYQLGDETRLKLGFDLDGNNSVQNPTNTTSIESDETLKSAWKYAVDTDNNGLKDTITLYGIYFRSPGQLSRERKPLDARTPPMDDGLTQQCPAATGFASLVGNSNWYKLKSGNLGKSFFVYTANVPITQSLYNSLPSQTGYEAYKGNKGVVALEFQQDRTRVPLPNNAVWFENDLEIVVGSTALLLNGRVHTNGNLLVAETQSGGNISFRQVSSKTSCFYNQENGQIIVGGNVKNGSFTQASGGDIDVDLYKGYNKPIGTTSINGTNRSTDAVNTAGNVEFNDAAYSKRIAKMLGTAQGLCANCYSETTASGVTTAINSSSYPQDVKDKAVGKIDTTRDSAQAAKDILSSEIEIFLRDRTRRVPFAEISDPTGTDADTPYTDITATLEPQATWREPLNTSNQLTGATSISVNTSQLNAVDPDSTSSQIQTYLGDRIRVGNNLPAKWLKDGVYVGTEGRQNITSSNSPVNWTGTSTPRWRSTQIEALADLGLFDRNGFWEESAATNPINDLDSTGGVRIVTGAGLYVDSATAGTGLYDRPTYSFLPTPTPAPGVTPGANDILVWPDTMPMSKPETTLSASTLKGDLLMRATAVYHYKTNTDTTLGKVIAEQEPIACVSSYYDPSDDNTIKNKSLTIPGTPGPPATPSTTVNLPWNAATGGRSNNGIVYSYPTAGRSTFFNTYKAHLERQSNLMFPNGRRVNQPLRDALANMKAANSGALPSAVPTTGLRLSDYSAIDTALCAINILNDEAGFLTTLTNKPPHGAIKEATFLDAREVKQLSITSDPDPTNYNLDLEQRQPLEIRVTDIDFDTATGITRTAITANEYLLPYSGIIYATRDDALPDASSTALLSATDFNLDATRRSNGIRLINGSTLARTSTNAYNAKEKGLILVTNLPAYIKGDFNLHRTSSSTGIEEFTETEPTSGTYDANNFYNRSTRNESFACRQGRPGCNLPTGDTTGDFWRSATIIADSMTLLSSNFQDGQRRYGDYDLNNNTGIKVEQANFDPATINTVVSPAAATVFSTLDSRRQARLRNGFWENSFIPSSYWTDGTTPRTQPGSSLSLGSYLLNGVTPIQRRVAGAPLYVMEICRKLPVSECGPNDWYVGFDLNGNGDLEVLPDGTNEQNIKAYQLGQIIVAKGGNLSDWTTAYTATGYSISKSIRQRLGAGDTSNNLVIQGGTQVSLNKDRRYPRRIAFARDNNNNLVKTTSGGIDFYQPLGVGCPLDTTGTNYAGNGCTGAQYGLSSSNTTGLWYRTTTSTTDPKTGASYAIDKPLFYYPPVSADGQPLLVPVLQIHDASNNPPDLRTDLDTQSAFRSTWLQTPATTNTFNATFVLGNSPSRGSETSAGLQNFVRFLENWQGSVTAKISGSFIQLKRSNFSTAPIAPIFTNKTLTTTVPGNVPGTTTVVPSATATNNLSLFDYLFDTYPTDNVNGLLPHYYPPKRQWGFDVALLSEQPDLFAQKFTSPSTGRPYEYFRQVGRDDPWVTALLCAREPATNNVVVPSEYRPSVCPSIPAD
ncbi:hypothetical protein NIES4074_42240 [Cylindrospermum sp. NIES-4074]|nr:hypothetical protein NIES4074_42240 [Cylindrospermum sp. NIES-4074]